MRYSVLALTLGALLGAGAGLAQSAASHTVAVSIPVVLRLSLDGAVGQTQVVPLQIEVAAGSYRITPSASRLLLFANSNWQLSASFTGDPALTWQLGVRSGRLRSYPQVLLVGSATGGWRPLTVIYGLAQLPADGRYQGLVVYTLTRP
jgi:hypothetical protein